MVYPVKFDVPDAVGVEIRKAANAEMLPVATYLRQLLSKIHTGKLMVLTPAEVQTMHAALESGKPRPVGRPQEKDASDTAPATPPKPENPIRKKNPPALTFIASTLDGPEVRNYRWSEIADMFEAEELPTVRHINVRFTDPTHRKEVTEAWSEYYDYVAQLAEWNSENE